MIRGRNGIYNQQQQQRHAERYQVEKRNHHYNNNNNNNRNNNNGISLNAVEQLQQQQAYQRLAPSSEEDDDDYDRDEEIASRTTTTSSAAATAIHTASTSSMRVEQQLTKGKSKTQGKSPPPPPPLPQAQSQPPPLDHLKSAATPQPYIIGARMGAGNDDGDAASAANYHTKWRMAAGRNGLLLLPHSDKHNEQRDQQTQPEQMTNASMVGSDNKNGRNGDGGGGGSGGGGGGSGGGGVFAIGIRRIRRPRQWLPQQQDQQQDAPTANSGTDNESRITPPAHPMKQRMNGNHDVGGGDDDDDADDIDCIKQRNYTEKGKAFIIEFLQGSSIHGFIYLAKMGLNFVERILWFAFICVALFSIIALSKRTWERFQTSPTVISMDRNKLVWNTSFPSLTVCPHKRIDELKVDDYIQTHTELFENEDDEDLFRDFIVKLASLTYENIETLPVNKSFGIPGDQYLDLIYELKWNFEPEISSGAAVQMFIYETLTEFGICHSVNSLVARYNSISYWKANDWSILDHGDRVTVHPLDGEIYAQIINLSTAYDVYFHGAGDVPIISKQRYTFPESDYTTVELIALEIYTNDAARAFTTKQRKCRFQHESDEMHTVPIYSFGLCLAECRMFFTLKVCGCVPHFYRNRLKSGRVLPICGFDGLRCVASIKREVITLKSDRYKINCNCLSNCDDSNFFVQSYRSRVWFLGANLQWGIIDYPKMQLRRDVLFSFADVLVYIGGLVGFFLGCSALSFTEIIYYFTARLIRRMFFN